jgi:hypothetical protein
MAAGLLLAFLVTKGLKIPCPVYTLTGISCPGCGNTRATLALLRFDFAAMLKFNLLYPIEIIYIARIYCLCAKNFVKRGAFRYHTRPDWIDFVCLSAILIWTVVRNILAI